MKKYNQLNLEDRERIAILKAKGKSSREIANKLSRSHSTVLRELSRNGAPSNGAYYLPQQADKRAKDRKIAAAKRDRLKNGTILSYIEAKLKLGWSPEQIAGRLPLEHPDLRISHEAIYQYIYTCKPSLIGYLPRRHKKRRGKGFYRKPRGFHIANKISIAERPEWINDRSEFGHWEADSAVCYGHHAALNVLTERKSRFVQITKISRKTAEHTADAVQLRLSQYSPGARRTITYDNGSENSQHECTNDKLCTQSYFCLPYHSWEKGTVENTIGLIRRFIPKGWDIDSIQSLFIRRIEFLLNNRPRKCLEFRTPLEVFNILSGALPR